jgi:hypothetical protein
VARTANRRQKWHLRFPAADLPKTLQQVVDEQRRGGATHEESVSVSRWSIFTSSIFFTAPACNRVSPFIGWRASRTFSSFSRPTSTLYSPQPSKSFNAGLALSVGCAPFPSATGSKTGLASLAIYLMRASIISSARFAKRRTAPFGMMKRLVSCVSSITTSALPEISPQPSTI